MVDLEADAWLASKVGLFWPNVSQFDQWHKRMQEEG